MGAGAYQGADAWRGMATEGFGSLGPAFITDKGLSADDQELRAMSNRITWVLRKSPEGGWKVIHEHSSSPADFDTAKVMLMK